MSRSDGVRTQSVMMMSKTPARINIRNMIRIMRADQPPIKHAQHDFFMNSVQAANRPIKMVKTTKPTTMPRPILTYCARLSSYLLVVLREVQGLVKHHIGFATKAQSSAQHRCGSKPRSQEFNKSRWDRVPYLRTMSEVKF